MKRMRWLLSVLALVATSGICAAAAWEVGLRDRTDPSQQQQAALNAWLLTGTPESTSLNTRRRYMHQLDLMLRDESTDWPTLIAADSQSQLRGNLEALARIWLLDAAAGYHRQSERTRDRYLAARARDLTAWKLPKTLLGNNTLSTLTQLQRRLIQDDSTISDEQRRQLEVFFSAIGRYALSRELRDLMIPNR